jgi:hypothetical protein
MARNIARVELKATISPWTIFITILGKWHTDYLKLYWLICVINITYLNSNMLMYLCLFKSINTDYAWVFLLSIFILHLHWLAKCLLSTVTDQDIVFLVPDSCWAAVYQWCELKSRRGKNKIWQLKNLIIALFGLIFKRIYNMWYLPSIICNFEIQWDRCSLWLSPA